jgi:hypothetical protein
MTADSNATSSPSADVLCEEFCIFVTYQYITMLGSATLAKLGV